MVTLSLIDTVLRRWDAQCQSGDCPDPPALCVVGKQREVPMHRVLCLVGIHHWEHHVNREMGGKGAGFDLCSRCGREKKAYDEGGNPGFKGLL